MIGVAAPALRFTARGATASRRSATPAIDLHLHAQTEETLAVRSLALDVRIDIAAERRRYTAEETERLFELFGAPEQWARSLGPVRWVNATANVPPFVGSTAVDVSLPCTYDFDVAQAKYLAALEGGEIPVDVVVSGTMFYSGTDGRLQTSRIPWDANLALRIPVAVWREAVDAAFPSSAWLRVGTHTFSALQTFRSRSGYTTWDETFAALLEQTS